MLEAEAEAEAVDEEEEEEEEEEEREEGKQRRKSRAGGSLGLRGAGRGGDSCCCRGPWARVSDSSTRARCGCG